MFIIDVPFSGESSVRLEWLESERKYGRIWTACLKYCSPQAIGLPSCSLLFSILGADPVSPTFRPTQILERTTKLLIFWENALGQLFLASWKQKNGLPQPQIDALNIVTFKRIHELLLSTLRHGESNSGGRKAAWRTDSCASCVVKLTWRDQPVHGTMWEYPLLIKFGENPLLNKAFQPPFLEDFPASHLWSNARVTQSSKSVLRRSGRGSSVVRPSKPSAICPSGYD